MLAPLQIKDTRGCDGEEGLLVFISSCMHRSREFLVSSMHMIHVIFMHTSTCTTSW